MSVQNGERLATKQDLADMYQGILPYLGGMPEVLANKFSKGDIYSTDEKMIGQWTDGKPLYAKTFDVGALPNNSYKSVSTGLTNENVKIIKGVAIASWGAINLPHITKESAYNVELSYEDHSIKIGTGTDRSSMDGSVTIYYTKTTDTAISIGEETEYSTDEKVVGTWIDGKPLYQKVVVKNNFRIANDTSFAHGIANVDKIFIKFAFMDDDGKSNIMPLIWSTSFDGVFIDATNIVFKGNGEWGADVTRTLYFVVQYTKTN